MTIKNNDLDLLKRVKDTLEKVFSESELYDKTYVQLRSLRLLILRLEEERRQYRQRMREYLRKKRQDNPNYGRKTNERIS